MREFGERFGDHKRVDLETTFRCSDRIAAVATDFVLRNPAQIRKTVRLEAQGRSAGRASRPSRSGRAFPVDRGARQDC